MEKLIVGAMRFLDCTLRDGGYYTNWDFSRPVVETYLKCINVLPVETIEVGYRSLPKKEYLGQYFYCPRPTLEHIRALAPAKKIAIMFNEKEVSPAEAAKLLEPVKDLVDIVRLAVQPERFEKAVALATAIRDHGFSVAFNLMYMSKVVKDDSVLSKLTQLNGVVDTFSLVDSYGGVYPEDVRNTVRKVKPLLKMDIGFHGHNNLELAFINSITAMEEGCAIVDGTVTGMGRGAGNLKTELFLTWLSDRRHMKVDYNALSQVVSEFEKLQAHYGWGTNLPYMVSGSNSLPQQDVMDWITKRTYAMDSIVQALQNQQAGTDNMKLPVLEPARKYEKALMIAGGPSSVEHAESIHEWISKNKKGLVLIHVSSRNVKAYEMINDVPQVHCLVGNEGKRLESIFRNHISTSGICLLPPYPRKMGTYIPTFMKNSSFELEQVAFTETFKDSHTAIALQAILNFNVQQCYAVGFDGYSGALMGDKEKDLLRENEYLFQKFNELSGQIISLTPTNYSSLKVSSVYSELCNP